MSEEVEVQSLRKLIKDLQDKLTYRSHMLANLVPHIEEWAKSTDAPSCQYIAFEFCEKFGEHILKFKDEYAQEGNTLN